MTTAARAGARARRNLGRAGALLAVPVAVATITASTALAATPTGDAATIALYRAVAANTNAQRAVQIVQHGYMTVSSTPTATTSFSYRFGYGIVAPGFQRAVETITYAQHLGRVVWVTDLLTAVARTCAPGRACLPNAPPIELFITKSAAFAGLATGPAHSVACFDREPFANVPYRAGGPWWSAVGDFRPKVARGNQVLVTVTYAWADGQHVTEVDSINVAKRLFAGSSIHVAKGPAPTAAPLSFSQIDTVLAATPVAPTVKVCG